MAAPAGEMAPLDFDRLQEFGRHDGMEESHGLLLCGCLRQHLP
jgi:hypothetical protein